MWIDFKINSNKSFQSRSLKSVILYHLLKLQDTIKLGYNDHGYNEFTAITNKYNSTFLVPNGTFVT